MCSVSLYRLWRRPSPASATTVKADAACGAGKAMAAAIAAKKSRRPNSDRVRWFPEITSEVTLEFTSPSRAHPLTWARIRQSAHHGLDGHQFAACAVDTPRTATLVLRLRNLIPVKALSAHISI